MVEKNECFNICFVLGIDTSLRSVRTPKPAHSSTTTPSNNSNKRHRYNPIAYKGLRRRIAVITSQNLFTTSRFVCNFSVDFDTLTTSERDPCTLPYYHFSTVFDLDRKAVIDLQASSNKLIVRSGWIQCRR